MSSPLISVCIPVFNGAGFIREAIDSVLSQTCSDFEVIIVDNCSTDNTVEIIQEYTDSRIKLFRNEANLGMIPNWNKTLEYATGIYIKILPADDLLYPDCLTLQTNILNSDKEKKIALVCGRRNIINDQGKILFNRGFTKKAVQLTGINAISRVIRSGGNIIGEGGAVMFRREILAKTGVFTSKIFYILDLDLWFKILLNGDLYAMPEIVSAFRVSASSASVQVANKQKEDYFNFIKLIYAKGEYKLSPFSYRYGLLKTALMTEAKKIFYKFVA
jgi:glycosyltransferase involved in cell wall biosynthesis